VTFSPLDPGAPNVASGPDQTVFWNRVAREDLDYHERQFDQQYRSTARLARFTRSLAGLRGGDAFDVGCGAGANIFHLGRELPGYRWTGLDIAGRTLFPIGRPRLAAAGLDVTLIEGDFFHLREIFAGRHFDLVLSIQNLSWIPSYEAALEQLLAVTRGWLVVTALFTDFQVDAKIEVHDYTWSADCQGPFYYNVYSLARFREFCEARGCQEFASEDFEIEIDLPRPDSGGLRTYTERLADGRRLQFTGPIAQPWKFVAVRMGN
jgi:ubiquinone/menaquinone biosynthesis C-methylase UbiE